MTPDQLWRSYIRPMGAGAVATAGLITLMKTMPTIVGALKAGFKDLGEGGRRRGQHETHRSRPRHEGRRRRLAAHRR